MLLVLVVDEALDVGVGVKETVENAVTMTGASVCPLLSCEVVKVSTTTD